MIASIYRAKMSRPSYLSLPLFHSLLLAVWYQLSDEQLAQCLFRDLLFRRFRLLELDGSVSDGSTVGRFRDNLVARDLVDLLLAEVKRQSKAKHIIITEGRVNIIDATTVKAVQSSTGKTKDGTPT